MIFSLQEREQFYPQKKENISSQRFEIVSIGNGYYNIIAEHSGKALQAVGDGKAGYAYIEQRERNSALEAQNGVLLMRETEHIILCQR